MSFYDETPRLLTVCPSTGVDVKTLTAPDDALWQEGQVSVGGHSWAALFATGATAQYPLLVKPAENPRWQEFEEFFGFRSGEYSPDRVRGVTASSFTTRARDIPSE